QPFVSVRTITTDAVGCPASPARSPSRRPVPVTVALPGLLVHKHLSAQPDYARPLTSLKCIRRGQQGQYCAFRAYEPCPGPACRPPPTQRCDPMVFGGLDQP